MKQKNWIKKYGIHMAACTLMIVVAFGWNQKIEIEKAHSYTVSSAVVLEELTELQIENGDYVFKGWGFDPEHYSGKVKCELILQDAETGEALWPKMEERPGKQEVGERYADGGDFSMGSFEGRISAGKVQEGSVYEILIRYTSEPEEGLEGELPYIVTASTGEFLCQGAVTDYNPRTFQPPEIAGTALEKELEGARLFHYFEEGMWVYVNHGKMYYIVDNIFPIEAYNGGEMGISWWATRLERIPEESQQYQMGNGDFWFRDYCSDLLATPKYKVAVRDLPSDYASILIIGLYDRENKAWVFGVRKQLREGKAS